MKHKYGGFVGAVTNPTQSNASGIWSHEEYIDANSKNLWPIPPNIVRRSLRFNSADSAYLNRTPASAGNRRTYTWSGWCKPSALVDQALFNAQANSSNGTQRTIISISGSGFLYINTDNLNTAMIWTVSSNNLLRDFSAWCHIVVAVDTTQSTTANRVRMYINGVEVSYASSTYPSQNYDDAINNTVPHYIGYEQHPAQSTKRLNCYLAEINFVDGQALTPTSFGEFDPQSGIWVPKPYTGTYGTNGYRLNFSDNSSTATLGLDSSGNGNNWTTNNFSVTAGTGNDYFIDTPSFYGVDNGLGGEVGGNYCTWNPNDKDTNVTLANGNLDLTAYNQGVYATWPLTSGKWYYEITLIDPYNGGGAINFFGYHGLIGVQRSAAGLNVSSYSGIYCNTDSADNNSPGIYQLGTRILAYTTFAINDIIGLAADIDNKTMSIYRNGTIIRGNITLANISTFYIWSGMNGTSGDPGTTSVNFGQRPFKFTAPSGFKALCTTNLQAPSIGLSVDNRADDHFNVVTYTGNGSTQTISNVGFQPDFVWIKNRDANANHRIFDSVRGADKILYSSLTNSEAIDAASGLTAFTSNGFSIGSAQVNDNGQRFVAWCWKAGGTPTSNTQGSITSSVSANQRAGFSILTYTGTGAAATIGHGLDSAPVFVIYKNRSVSSNWIVYSLAINNASQGLMLNSTNAVFTDSTPFNGVAPTSSLLTVGTNYQTNGNGNSIVAYCWRSVPGFSAFGSYTGNGSADGTFIYTGFRPRWILIKSSSFSPTNWILHDTERQTYNPDGNLLLPDNYGTEISNSSPDYIDILSNGFKNRGAGEAQNRTSTTYIYAAFAESPFRQALAR